LVALRCRPRAALMVLRRAAAGHGPPPPCPPTTPGRQRAIEPRPAPTTGGASPPAPRGTEGEGRPSGGEPHPPDRAPGRGGGRGGGGEGDGGRRGCREAAACLRRSAPRTATSRGGGHIRRISYILMATTISFVFLDQDMGRTGWFRMEKVRPDLRPVR